MTLPRCRRPVGLPVTFTPEEKDARSSLGGADRRRAASGRSACTGFPWVLLLSTVACASGPLPSMPAAPDDWQKTPGALPPATPSAPSASAQSSVPLATSTPNAASDSAKAPKPSGDSLTSILDSHRDEGLVVEDLQVGLGPSVQMGDDVKMHYVGRLEDGTEFDASRNRPGTFDVKLGKGMLIKGFERGMVGMKVGGVRRVRIPWRLGYGEAGSPPRIPPKANLVFEIELLDIPVPAPRAAPKGPPMGGPGGGAPPPQ